MMAMYVSGRTSKYQFGSDEIKDMYCDHCRMTGQSVSATVYCPTCDEYLCSSCSLMHAGAKSTKYHTLEDIGTSTGSQATAIQIPKWQECPEHNGKAIRSFCKSHDVLCCLTCLDKHHQSCLNTVHITDVAKRLIGTEEFKSFKSDLKNAEREKTTQWKILKSNKKTNKSDFCKTLDEINSIAEKAHARIDILKANTIKIAKGTKKDNKTKLKQMTGILKRLESDIQCILADVECEDKTNPPERQFIAWKLSQNKLENAKSDVNNLKEGNAIKTFRLDQTEEIDTLLHAKSVLGTFSDALSLKYVDQINVQSSNDKGDCNINGITIVSPRQILVSDDFNKRVKLVDLKDKSLVKDMKCSAEPSEVKLLDNNLVGLLHFKRRSIQLLRADNIFQMDHEIKIDNNCIAVVQGQQQSHFIISCYDKVQIVDMSGTVVREFNTDTTGNPLFHSARFIDLSPDRSLLYVSDDEMETVTCLTLDGDVKSVYRDAQLRKPNGIAVDKNGYVLVCSGDTHSIHVLSPDCLKLKIVSVRQHRLMFPKAIAFCPTSSKLYISSSCTNPNHCNSIKVFEFK